MAAGGFEAPSALSVGRPACYHTPGPGTQRPEMSTSMSDFRIGKFQVVGTLGTGAHSTILHVRRAEDGKNYALKVVPIDSAEDEKFLNQAEHEFRVASMLSHPNLIKVHALEK